ncbi:hypothetical protein Igag_1327 [Ignisphaera aggregans DSM 17230]|uniref:Uncharacterized protein n=1 Tax=Ignisphaera aggregans (strain DSM 17230 / JCM 13409 / AQ1.S1) TaxID=583356 RepID=E0SPZ9_IGNAA|nr:hypothetical protein Igag_1327 [Ignisphaera aggregans DSM 17230]
MPDKSDAVIIRPSLIFFPNLLSIIIRIDINTKFKSDSSNLLSIVEISIVFTETKKYTNPIVKAERCGMGKYCCIADPLAML